MSVSICLASKLNVLAYVESVGRGLLLLRQVHYLRLKGQEGVCISGMGQLDVVHHQHSLTNAVDLRKTNLLFVWLIICDFCCAGIFLKSEFGLEQNIATLLLSQERDLEGCLAVDVFFRTDD